MVWWCLSVRPSGSPSVRLSVRPSVRPGLRPSGSPSASFPHFSPTCYDILSWNFAYDFVLLYYRSSSSVVNLCQVLWELCPFCYLQYRKYTVFHTFLLHALTYWAEILHMTLFHCTTDQVRVLSICINFLWELCPFWNLDTENTQYSVLFSYILWHVELKFCTWLCFTEIQIKFKCRQFASIFVRVMPLLELRILEIQFFRTFLLHALTYWAEIFHTTLFNVLQIKFECRHSVSILFIWNLKFDVGFFIAFLLEKYKIKIAFQNVHDGRIMHR